MNKRYFRHFYSKNFDKIYRFVFYRVGGDQDLTEDLVSEIFMKALEKFHTFDPGVSSVAWLYTIAKNHLANFYRSKYFRDVEPLQVEVWWQDPTWELLDEESEQKIFFKMLKELSDEEQRLITLKYIEGFSYEEISEFLKKPKVTLRVAAHRAVNKLKKLAERYELKENSQGIKERKPARQKM